MNIEKVIGYEIKLSESELMEISAIFWSAKHTTVDTSVPEKAEKFRTIVNEAIDS